ncbi:hypothetical protein RB653_003210 [Dictyostelium firmibasis]|uniref:AB hydrolase-1 domain-containing protein n=1 Tax=Dictyostelium firmibasis TaxID=79012 RepID=A0AAN7YTJ7_9MYCE
MEKHRKIEPSRKGYAIVGENIGKPNRIYYETFGNGPKKILFITGFLSSSKGWCKQIDYFTKNEEYEICVFDNRGVGKSNIDNKHSYNFSTESMASDAIDLLENTLKWDKVHICGLSMGGMASIHLTSRIPGKVQSLSVACIPNGYFIPLFSNGAFNYIRALFTGDEKKKARIFQSLMYSDEYLDTKTNGSKETRSEQMFKKNSTGFSLDGPSFLTILGHQIGYITNRFSKKTLEIIKNHAIPTIVINSDNDSLVTNNLTIKQIVNPLKPMGFHVIKGGHLSQLENPTFFNKLVENHIDKHSNWERSTYFESNKLRNKPQPINHSFNQNILFSGFSLKKSFFNYNILKSFLTKIK